MNWNSSTEAGWSVNLAEDGSAIVIFDPSGSLYSKLFPTHTDESDRTPGSRKRESSVADQDRQVLTFRKGHPATLHLADGTIGTVTDQKPGAMRRKNKRCEVAISGRTYTFAHSSSRRATALRDGIVLAHMARGRWSNRNTVTRKTVSVTDALDECVLTIFQKVVTPGRTGALDQVMTDLSNV
ncbi:hypothetical protein QM716_21170 [Rhodococcus sp. IEGM 1409]|uniref:hypothetical protein n=1 Tax=Rhodococcus sp. IEGM 1409 TaxID=3047082 RepID=UPI0024B79762|nr:hypothetical protein [Rhodococcus sp. IEGM 1409]MDI9902370.1 hypothetical protein [Rhodococcus sp. IEGM 1409]